MGINASHDEEAQEAAGAAKADDMEFEKGSVKDEQPIEEPQPRRMGPRMGLSLFKDAFKQTFLEGYIEQLQGDDDR